MKKTMALLALGGAAGAAQAADNGFYVGIGAGLSDFHYEQTLDDKDHGLKLLAGVRLLDSFGVEASYTDHGRAIIPSGIACIALVGTDCPDTARVKATTTSAFAVGFLDFPLVDLFGKLGYSLTDSKFRVPGYSSFADSDNDGGLAWGVGAQAHLGSLGLRAEYEQSRTLLGNERLSIISASFVYTFL